MPIYVYRCQSCELEFDRLEKLNEAPQDKCPTCKGEGKRIITSANFILKGEKWFKNSGGY